MSTTFVVPTEWGLLTVSPDRGDLHDLPGGGSVYEIPVTLGSRAAGTVYVPDDAKMEDIVGEALYWAGRVGRSSQDA